MFNIVRGVNKSIYSGLIFNSLPGFVKKFVYKKRFINNLDIEIASQILSLSKIKKAVVFDCGGNVGLWTDIFISLGCSVKVFEPSEDCYKFLIERFKGLGNVEVFPVALSNIKGVQQFYRGELSFSESGSLNSRKNNVSESELATVKVDKLSTYIRNYKPHFVKIDVEGSEVEILQDLLFNLTNEELSSTFFAIETHEMKILDLEERLQVLKAEIKERGLTQSFNFKWH